MFGLTSVGINHVAHKTHVCSREFVNNINIYKNQILEILHIAFDVSQFNLR